MIWFDLIWFEDVQKLNFIFPTKNCLRLYSGYFDCIKQVLGKEGILAFYKGLAAQYFRCSRVVDCYIILVWELSVPQGHG